MKCEELNKTQVFRNRRGNIGGEVASRGKRVGSCGILYSCLLSLLVFLGLSFLFRQYVSSTIVRISDYLCKCPVQCPALGDLLTVLAHIVPQRCLTLSEYLTVWQWECLCKPGCCVPMLVPLLPSWMTRGKSLTHLYLVCLLLSGLSKYTTRQFIKLNTSVLGWLY